MTTATETQTCEHCHGTGRELTSEQEEILARLIEAGLRRGEHHTSRKLAGRAALLQAYEDIRVLAPEAARLGFTREQIAAAVGVKRQNLHLILTGQAGN